MSLVPRRIDLENLKVFATNLGDREVIDDKKWQICLRKEGRGRRETMNS